MFKISDPQIFGCLMLEFGALNMGMLRFCKALDIYNKALMHFEKLNWITEMSVALSQIGLIYALFSIIFV